MAENRIPSKKKKQNRTREEKKRNDKISKLTRKAEKKEQKRKKKKGQSQWLKERTYYVDIGIMNWLIEAEVLRKENMNSTGLCHNKKNLTTKLHFEAQNENAEINIPKPRWFISFDR